MIRVDEEYVIPALEAVEPWLFILPTAVQRKLRLALSLLRTHGEATREELAAELGENWVLARRSPSVIERYGEDVKCHTQKQYEQAERRAIERRVP